MTDVDYLVEHFTPLQLRREARYADEKVKNIKYGLFGDILSDNVWALYSWWYGFARELKEAIKITEGRQPKVANDGKYVRVDVADLKSRSDIIAVIEAHGVELRKAGRNFIGLCPFHNEKTPSFTVYPGQSTYHCFGCGKGGDVISFLQEAEHTDFMGAVALLEKSV